MEDVSRRRKTAARLVRALVVLSLATLFLYLAGTYILLANVARYLRYNDFGKFYLSVMQVREGRSLYAPNEATRIPFSDGVFKQFLNLNPPHFHFLVWPFSLFDVRTGFILWGLANLALALLSFAAISRELSLRPTAQQKVAVLVIACAAGPTMAWFVTGQFTGILLALATVAWIGIRRERSGMAGVAVGVACALKLFLLPLGAYLLLRRRWTAAFVAGGTGLACFAVGMLVFGAAEYREWLRALGTVNWQWAAMNASLSAPLIRATVGDPVNPLPMTGSVQIANDVAAAVVLCIGLAVAVRARGVDEALTVVLLTCLLASPLGWVYYHWILAGPAVATFRRPTALVYVACAGLLVPFLVLFPWPSMLFALTMGSLYTWSTFALWCAAVRAALRSAESRPSFGTGRAFLPS